MLVCEVDGESGLITLRLARVNLDRAGERLDPIPMPMPVGNLLVMLVEAPKRQTLVESICFSSVEDLQFLPQVVSELEKLGFDLTDLNQRNFTQTQNMCRKLAELQIQLPEK